MGEQVKIHKVYMSFFCRGQWVCGFLEPDLKTPVCRSHCFDTEDKLRELIARTPTKMNLEARNMLDHAIANGRGGLYLDLTHEQYRKLKG